MSRTPRRKLLLVSDSEDWREAMTFAFDALDVETARASGDRSIARAAASSPSAFVIDVDGGMELASASDRFERAAITAGALRAVYLAPIVLVTSVPIDDLNILCGTLGGASVMLDRILDAAALAADILTRLPGVDDLAVAAVQFATVELTIAEATLQCDIRAGGQCQSWATDWKAYRHLELLNEEFSQFEATEESFRTLNLDKINLAGRRLLMDVFEEPLARASDFCRANLPDQRMIHHRIVLDDEKLEFVPFEIVTTKNPAEYLRFVNPLARRLIPRQEHRSPDRVPVAGRAHRRVLFILSKAAGLFRLDGETFKGKAAANLGALAALDSELTEIRALYNNAEFTALTLDADTDNIAAITKAFTGNTFDIVHFAGHSIRADSRRVFLALPAPPGRPVVPYDVEDFARLASDSDTRLVILSSCEGASGLAMSRMASRGIPAVAGFRWPVIDADACRFTVALHAELRREGVNVPVSTAFHRALLTLRQYAPHRLTGFSPVLTIQRSTWHDFALEDK